MGLVICFCVLFLTKGCTATVPFGDQVNTTDIPVSFFFFFCMHACGGGEEEGHRCKKNDGRLLGCLLDASECCKRGEAKRGFCLKACASHLVVVSTEQVGLVHGALQVSLELQLLPRHVKLFSVSLCPFIHTGRPRRQNVWSLYSKPKQLSSPEDSPVHSPIRDWSHLKGVISSDGESN